MIFWMSRSSNTVVLSICVYTNYINDAWSMQTVLAGTCQTNERLENSQKNPVRRAHCWKMQSWASPITLSRCGTWRSWILTWINGKNWPLTSSSGEVFTSNFKSWRKICNHCLKKQTQAQERKIKYCQPRSFQHCDKGSRFITIRDWRRPTSCI